MGFLPFYLRLRISNNGGNPTCGRQRAAPTARGSVSVIVDFTPTGRMAMCHPERNGVESKFCEMRNEWSKTKELATQGSTKKSDVPCQRKCYIYFGKTDRIRL